MTLSTDKTQLASQIALAEGLSGNELKERVAALEKYSVAELSEKLQTLLNGGVKYNPSVEQDDWGYLDVQISKNNESEDVFSDEKKVKVSTPSVFRSGKSDELKTETIEKIRNDAYHGLELVSSTDNGFIGNSYNALKEYLHSQFSKSAVSKVLYSQAVSSDLMELANNNNLTRQEYLDAKRQLLYDIYPNIEKVSESGKDEIQKRIQSLKPDELNYFQNMILSAPNPNSANYDDYVREFEDLFNTATSDKTTITVSNDGIMRSNTEFKSHEKFNLSQDKAQELIKFEEVYFLEQGTKYDAEKIENYSDAYMNQALLNQLDKKTQQTKERLQNSITTVKGNERYGVSSEVAQHSQEVLNNALYSVLYDRCHSEELVNNTLKAIVPDKNVEFKDGQLQFKNVQNSPFKIPMNSATLVEISEKLLESDGKLLDEALGNKTLEQHENELSQKYEAAYGNKNATLLAQAYENDQTAAVKKVRSAVEYAGMGLMVGGMILYPPAAIVGAATASFGGVGVEMADELSKKSVSDEKLIQLTKELATNGGLLLAGMGAGTVGNAAKTALLTKNCPKLIATVADVGTDATISLGADLMLTGNIDLKAEGFSQIMSLVTGHLVRTKKVNAGNTQTDFKHSVLAHPKIADIKLYNELIKIKDKSGKPVFSDFTIRKIMDAYTNSASAEISKLNKEIQAKFKDPQEAGEVLKSIVYNPVMVKTQDFEHAKLLLSRSNDLNSLKSTFSKLTLQKYNLQKEALSIEQEYEKLYSQKLLIFDNLLNEDNVVVLKKAIKDNINGNQFITQKNLKKFLADGYKLYDNPDLTLAQKSALLNSRTYFSNAMLQEVLSGNNTQAKKEILSVLNEITPQNCTQDSSLKGLNRLNQPVNDAFRMQVAGEFPIESLQAKFKQLDGLSTTNLSLLSKLGNEIKEIEDPTIKEIAQDNLSKLMDCMRNGDENTFDQLQSTEELVNIYKSFCEKSVLPANVQNYYDYLKKEYPDKALRFEQLLDGSVKQKSILQKIKEKYIGPNALESFDSELAPVLRDFKNDKKFEPMKQWVAKYATTRPDEVNKVYEKFYLLKLPEKTAQLCRNISDDFGTKVFLGDSDNTDVLQYVYNELFEWRKSSGGKCVVPDVLDLSKIKEYYIDKSLKANGYYDEVTNGVYIDGDKLPDIKTIVRHEIMHANVKPQADVSTDFRAVEASEIFVHKKAYDKNGNAIQVVDPENCKYFDELKSGLESAGIDSSYAYYAYTDRNELIAVAAEGDYTKYSPEFKQALIKLGMPKWVFKMDKPANITSTEQVYYHKDYSDKYMPEQNQRISKSARDQYNSAINSFDGVYADYNEFFNIPDCVLSSRVKTLDGIFEKHYRQLAKYDKMKKKAFEAADPQVAKGKNQKPLSADELRQELLRIDKLKSEALNEPSLIQKKIEDSIGARLVMNDCSSEAVEKVFQKVLNAIDSGKVKLSTINNYCGKGMEPYFTPQQIEQIYLHCKAQGYEPYIVSPIKTPSASIDTDYDFHPLEAEKPSGYTTVQMNFVHSNGFVSEFQIRGHAINELAESEHIIYDIREGKDITKKDPEIAAIAQDVIQLIKKMDLKENAYIKEQYSNYLTKCYEYAKISETNPTAQKPELPEYIDQRLGIENIIELHHKISDISNRVK